MIAGHPPVGAWSPKDSTQSRPPVREPHSAREDRLQQLLVGGESFPLTSADDGESTHSQSQEVTEFKFEPALTQQAQALVLV